jgi:purine-binding chemotaxis protein CheW
VKSVKICGKKFLFILNTEIMAKTKSHTRQTERAESKVLNFKVGGEEFSVDINLFVCEILKNRNTKPVENASSIADKILEYRGEIIPVADMRRCLGLEVLEKEASRIIVSEIEKRKIGFAVDSITGITAVNKNDLEPAPEIIVSSILSDYIIGVYKKDGKLFTLLDFEKILTEKERKKLNQLLKQFEKEKNH